jgi:hypothetical protein
VKRLAPPPLELWAPLAFVAFLLASPKLCPSGWPALAAEPAASVAVPYFVADGRPAEPRSFARFTVAEASRLAREGLAGAAGEELRRWIAASIAPPRAEPGPSRFLAGVRTVTVGPDGRLREAAEAIAEGRAWPTR